MWWEDHEIPYFGLWFNIPKKKPGNSELVKILDKELPKKNGWLFDESDNVSPYFLKPITDFLNTEDDCIPAMKDFVKRGLINIYEFKKKYPKVLKS